MSLPLYTPSVNISFSPRDLETRDHGFEIVNLAEQIRVDYGSCEHRSVSAAEVSTGGWWSKSAEILLEAHFVRSVAARKPRQRVEPRGQHRRAFRPRHFMHALEGEFHATLRRAFDGLVYDVAPLSAGFGADTAQADKIRSATSI